MAAADGTFTYVNQLDIEGILDEVAFVLAVGGYLESIKPIADRPGVYSIVSHPMNLPLVREQATVSAA
jgi:hypothetical protein